MAQAPGTPIHTGAKRRSQRVRMQVLIRIRGKDAQGKEFEELTQTLAINAHGALVLLTARLISGAVVHMRHNKTEEEEECHVAFLGPVRGGKAEIGLEFSKPCPMFRLAIDNACLCFKELGRGEKFYRQGRADRIMVFRVYVAPV